MRKILFACFIILPVALLGQLTPEQALKTLDEKYPQEKLHIFTDRGEYVAGETVFFKAYLFSGYVKSLISSTVYLEVYSADTTFVTSVSVPMWNALGAGSFKLPESANEGVYHIRAFTKWMLNFDPSFMYYSTVLVYNSSSKKKLQKAPVKWTAAAFPESGVLLAGEENKVAIRLTAAGSLPEKWRGTLINKSKPNEPLLHFESLTPDVSAFLFTPELNNVYEVHIKDDLGNATFITLSPSPTGVLLRAEQSGNEVYVDMFFKGVRGGGKNYKLVAHMQQQLVQSTVIRKEQELIKTSIPVEKLMPGVLHLTLFDPKGWPVAERLVFIENSKGRLKDEKKAIDTSAASIRIKIDSSEVFSYTVSVTDGGSTRQRARNIYSDLWFGDLTLLPENAVAYFTGKEEDFLSRDALLITEKWDRFQWSKVLNDQFPAIKDSAEQYFSYRGTVTRNNTAIGKETLTLLLRFPDSSLQFVQVQTNDFGEFHLDDIVFYDTVKVFYQPAKGKRTKDVEISFEKKHPLRRRSPVRIPRTSFQLVEGSKNDTLFRMVENAQQQWKAEQESDRKYSAMEEVKVSAERKTKKELLNEELATPLFQTQNEQVFDIINEEPSIQSYANIFDWLDGRVAGLNFRIIGESDPEHDTMNLSLIGQRVPMMRDQNVSLFIDEMPADLVGIYTLPTSEIAMVKVIKGYFLGASGGGAGGGAIAVYTRKAGLNKNERTSLPSGLLTGYSPLRTFSPSPANKNLYQWVLIPNLESWEILIKLPAKSEMYRVAVTGFTSDAVPVYLEYMAPGK